MDTPTRLASTIHELATAGCFPPALPSPRTLRGPPVLFSRADQQPAHLEPSPLEHANAIRYDAADHTLDTSYTWEVNVKGKRTYIDGRFTAGAKNPLPMVNGAKTKAQLQKVNVEVRGRVFAVRRRPRCGPVGTAF